MTLKRDELELASQSDDPVYAGLARQMLAADDKVQVKRKDTGRVVWVTKDNANDPEYEKPDGKPGDDAAKEDLSKGDTREWEDLSKEEQDEAGAADDREEAEHAEMTKQLNSLVKKHDKHELDVKKDELPEKAKKMSDSELEAAKRDFSKAMDLAVDSDDESKADELETVLEALKAEQKGRKDDKPGDDKAKKKEEAKKKEDKPKKKLDGKDLSKLKKFRENLKTKPAAKKRLEQLKKDVKEGKKPKPEKTDAQLLQEFKVDASAAMKERMEGMSPLEFVEMLAAITDEEDMGKAASLRKDLIRVASVMRPSLKRTALIQMLAADDKVKVKRKDTGREVWVTKDKASGPDYEKVKDAPKEESSKDKPEKKEKGDDSGETAENDPHDRKIKIKKDLAGVDLVEGHSSKDLANLLTGGVPVPDKEIDEIVSDLKTGIADEKGEDNDADVIKSIEMAISTLNSYKKDGKKANMNLRKDLIRLASTMAPSPERTQLIQVLAASKTPDGGDAPDEGGDDEGSEDPNEHPGEGDGGDDENGVEGCKKATLKLGAKLSPEQVKEVKSEIVAKGVPVRFMSGGGSLNISTGEVSKKGTNVMHQIVYWGFTKETSKKIAKWLGVKAKFDKTASVKVASFPYLDPRSKNLAREGVKGGGLTKAILRSGDGFALYNVDKGKNHSKFYEGMVMPDESMPGSHRAVFRWGAMTDNGFTGRVDGKKYDEKFRGLSEAQAYKALSAKKRAKLGRGYIDTFGPKHKDPITGKRLKQGEYPIGLARDVGFGWGVQEMAFCVPALRQIGEEIAAALDPNDGTSAIVDLKAALRLVSGVPDSNMAGKITKYIGGAMREINRGADQVVINKRLYTIKNYIDKQVALCD